MKRFLIILALLSILIAAISAEESLFTIGGITDASVIAGADGGTLTAGQDVNTSIGPMYLNLTADWTMPLWEGDHVLDLGYTLGFSKVFGIFTPKLELTGDQSYPLIKDAVSTGDWFSDLMPSLNITFGKIGADIYSDLSFEPGYKIFQTLDVSGFYNFTLGSMRLGFLYMDAQAVTDDVGHPNAPACKEGYSVYAKASVSY